MTAILTDKLRKIFVDRLLADAQDSDTAYFIGVGRTESWDSADTVPVPVNTDRQDKLFRNSLQSVKAVVDYSFVIPRYDWTSGTTYFGYNDNTTGQPSNSYYVKTDDNAVYLCVQSGRNSATGQEVPSTVKPTGTSAIAFSTADGYIWKFLYTIGTASAARFLSSNYMPVRLQGLTDSNSLAVEVEQEIIQNAAVPGQIVGYRVLSGGTGYSSGSPPAVTVSGNGTGALAKAVVGTTGAFSGRVVAVEVDDSAGGIPFGTGYDYATVTIAAPTGAGSTATAVPIFGPQGGLGADPRDDLRADAIMFNVKPAADENDDWVVGNDFRQIGLIRNVQFQDSDGVFTGTTGRAMRKMTFDSGTGTGFFNNEQIVRGGTSLAEAVVDLFQPSEAGSKAYLYYHQTETTGFGTFQSGETVTGISPTGGSGIIFADSAPEVDPYSGQLLYLDNVTTGAVERATGQTEDIKIVIQL